MFNVRVSAAAVIGCLLASAAQAQYVAPYNLEVIVLDSSISFQKPVGEPGAKGKVPVVEALGVTQRLFSASSTQKRRRNTGVDRYVIIAADAASQVIWRGNRAELANLTADALLEMLRVRRQFAQCTDYKAAMNAAAKALREYADATNMSVLTFGDLIHEPPTTSYRACAPASGEPPAGIDWDTLSAAALGFYFVSTDFKLRPNQHWLEFLESRELRPDFKDMAQTLTQPLELPAPPPAVYRPTQEQTEAAKQQWVSLKSSARTVGTWILVGGLLAVGVLFGVIARARRRPAGRRIQRGSS